MGYINKYIVATTSRSIVKALTFRILVSILGFLIAYTITRSIDVSLRIFSVHAIVATIIYFIHERVWDKIQWGVKR